MIGKHAPERVRFLLERLADIVNQQDPTLQALRLVAEPLTVELAVIGGIAVALHGYERTTSDRDLLASREDAERMAAALEQDNDWQRQDNKEFSFLHVPTNCPVEIAASGDPAAEGAISYSFPKLSELAMSGSLEGVPVVSLNDLIFLKLIAGRARDHADIMELCKLHMDNIDFEAILARLDPADVARREKLAEIREQAPMEIEAEQQRDWPQRDMPNDPAGTQDDS